MNKYNEIKTIPELMMFVRLHGIDSSDIDFINYAADIIRHAKMDELAQYAKEDKQIFFLITRFTWSMTRNIVFYIDYISDTCKEYKTKALMYDKICEQIAELTKERSMRDNEIESLKEDKQWLLVERNSNLALIEVFKKSINDLEQTVKSLKLQLDITDKESLTR